MKLDGRQFMRAMRSIAGTVSLVSVGRHGDRTGLTVTSVISLTVDPPILGISVNKSASAHDRIKRERCFAVSVLNHGHTAVANTFAGRTGVDGEDRFSHQQWGTRKTGAPLFEDAVASFDCKLALEFDVGSHTLFGGEVVHVECQGTLVPLVYFDGSYVSLA